MKYILTLIMSAASLAGCAASGSASDAALSILIATRGYALVDAYAGCSGSQNAPKSELFQIERMLDELLFQLAAIEEGDVSTILTARGMLDQLVAAHDACVASDPSLSEPERARALRDSSAFMAMVREAVRRWAPEEQAAEPQ